MPFLHPEEVKAILDKPCEYSTLPESAKVQALNALLMNAFPVFCQRLLKDSDLVLARRSDIRVAGIKVPTSALEHDAQAAFVECVKGQLPVDAAVLFVPSLFPAFVPYVDAFNRGKERLVEKDGYCGWVAFCSKEFDWVDSSGSYPSFDIKYPASF